MSFEEEPFITSFEELGVLLKNARKQKGWTRQELAQYAEEPESLICDLEEGKSTWNILGAYYVFRALGINPLGLPGGDPRPPLRERRAHYEGMNVQKRQSWQGIPHHRPDQQQGGLSL